ncbi:hypothetical protein ACJX0J_040484, partial [Zea mays]
AAVRSYGKLYKGHNPEQPLKCFFYYLLGINDFMECPTTNIREQRNTSIMLMLPFINNIVFLKETQENITGLSYVHIPSIAPFQVKDMNLSVKCKCISEDRKTVFPHS